MIGIKRAIVVVIIGGLVLLLFRNWSGTAPGWLAPGQLQVAWQQDQSWSVGELQLRWFADSSHLELHHNQSVVWSSRPGRPWLAVARLNEGFAPARLATQPGSIDTDRCESQNWFEARVNIDGISLSGRLECGRQSVPVEFHISAPSPDEVAFEWMLPGSDGAMSSTEPLADGGAGQPNWVVALDQPVSEQSHSFGLGPLRDQWRLDADRYVAVAEPEGPAGSTVFITMDSRFQAWAIEPGSTAVVDRRQPGISRIEFWRTNDPNTEVTGRAVLLSAQNPLDLVRGIRATGQTPPMTIEAGADGLRDIVRRRIALGLNGVADNNRPLAEAPWLPPAPTTPDERVTWLAWLGLSSLAAPTWPLADDPLSQGGMLDIHADRLARLHTALSPYRSRWQEAADTGAPVIRPLWFEFPDEPGAWSAGVDQFMLGSDLLAVVPPTTGDALSVYLPAGVWTDLWTGIEWRSDGRTYTLPSSPDEPPALLRGSAGEHDELMDAAAALSTTRILRGGDRFSSTDAPLRLE